jgi:hypothetical protein
MAGVRQFRFTINKGEAAMRLHRMIRALDQFEDSPLGMVFGLAVLITMMLIPLYLNEAGMR